jgi:hypothetical protein
MANGAPGDHPVNDILDHGRAVFSPEADALVRDIAGLVPRYRLWELVDWLSPPPIEAFTAQLRKLRDDLRADARDRGWDV